MIYANEIVVRRSQRLADGFTIETEVIVCLNDQQPNLDPEDVKETVQAIAQALSES